MYKSNRFHLGRDASADLVYYKELMSRHSVRTPQVNWVDMMRDELKSKTVDAGSIPVVSVKNFGTNDCWHLTGIGGGQTFADRSGNRIEVKSIDLNLGVYNDILFSVIPVMSGSC